MSILSNVLEAVAPALATLAGGPLAGSVVSWISKALFGKDDVPIANIITAIKDPSNLVRLQELETEIGLARMKSEDSDKDRQANINAIEAQSESFWKSGARPAALWISVLGFGYNFIAVPICNSFGIPAIGVATDELMWLLSGLLGLGAMRTVEKIKRK